MELHCDVGSAERGWFKTRNHSQYSQSTPVTNHVRLSFVISRSHDMSIILFCFWYSDKNLEQLPLCLKVLIIPQHCFPQGNVYKFLFGHATVKFYLTAHWWNCTYSSLRHPSLLTTPWIIFSCFSDRSFCITADRAYSVIQS